MVSVGVVDEPVNQAYDVISTGALLLNLAASIMLTFDNVSAKVGPELKMVETATVFFLIDYILRLYIHKLEASIRVRIINTEERSCCFLLLMTSVITFSES